MAGNFLKIKKSVRLRTQIVASCVGACCALLGTGGLLLALKLSFVSLAWYYYLLVGLGLFLLFGGIFYLACRYSPQKLAKKLDDTYRLGERVQTMVEFDGVDEPFYNLQRADTEQRLGSLTRKKLSGWKKALFSIVTAVCVATFAVGVFLPQRVHTPPYTPPEGELPFDLKAEQIADLRKLIENVQGDVELRTVDPEREGEYLTAQSEYVASLNTLLTTLQGEITNNQMRDAVTRSMREVIEATAQKTSFQTIAKALNGAEEAKFMGDAFLQAGKAYATDHKITYSYVKQQAGATLDSAVSQKLSAGTAVIATAVAETTELGAMQLVVNSFQYALNTQLETLTEEDISLEDALYTATAGLCKHLKVLGSATGVTAKAVSDALNQTAIPDFLSSASDVTYKQAYLCLMRDYILQDLNGVFGIPIPEITDEPEAEEGGKGEEGGGNAGGGGDGLTQWPGSDELFDPNSETYKHYGELLNGGRYAQILEVLDNGEVPDEVKSCILKYLDQIKSTQPQG